MTRVVAFVPDLMDRSRLARLGADVEVVHASSPAALSDLAQPDDLVVLDLSRPGVLDALASGLAGRVVGFASHVDAELIAAAESAGCPEVLPRSRFFARLPELLAADD